MLMRTYGVVFQPDLIELMKAVLDEAAALLPEAKRTASTKSEIGSCILACAANDERGLVVRKTAALAAVAECTHYSHDISPTGQAV